MVIDPNFQDTEFIDPGVEAFLKGRTLMFLLMYWRAMSFLVQVVYIGKAGSPTGKATLYSRIGQYLRFCQTKNVGHMEVDLFGRSKA